MTEPHIPGPEDVGNPEDTVRLSSNRSRSKELLLPRLLATLISFTLIGLGTMAMVTQSYYGRTSKLGGAEVSLSGGPSVAMGLTTVFLGLLPLALWFPGKRLALVWSLASIVAAGISFYLAVYA